MIIYYLRFAKNLRWRLLIKGKKQLHAQEFLYQDAWKAGQRYLSFLFSKIFVWSLNFTTKWNGIPYIQGIF